jgi:hypothetical protein
MASMDGEGESVKSLDEEDELLREDILDDEGRGAHKESAMTPQRINDGAPVPPPLQDSAGVRPAALRPVTVLHPPCAGAPESEEDERRLAGKVCTYTRTSNTFSEQHWYHCWTCGLTFQVGGRTTLLSVVQIVSLIAIKQGFLVLLDCKRV